jgi:uncharacterized membrane protein (DUF4010 family)
LTLVLLVYWADRKHGPGIITELASLMTFFLGVLILLGALELAISLASLRWECFFQRRPSNGFPKPLAVMGLAGSLLTVYSF